MEVSQVIGVPLETSSISKDGKLSRSQKASSELLGMPQRSGIGGRPGAGSKRGGLGWRFMGQLISDSDEHSDAFLEHPHSIPNEISSIDGKYQNTVDGCEILHQLVDGLSHDNQNFAVFQSYQ